MHQWKSFSSSAQFHFGQQASFIQKLHAEMEWFERWPHDPASASFTQLHVNDVIVIGHRTNGTENIFSWVCCCRTNYLAVIFNSYLLQGQVQHGSYHKASARLEPMPPLPRTSQWSLTLKTFVLNLVFLSWVTWQCFCGGDLCRHHFSPLSSEHRIIFFSRTQDLWVNFIRFAWSRLWLCLSTANAWTLKQGSLAFKSGAKFGQAKLDFIRQKFGLSYLSHYRFISNIHKFYISNM